MKKIRKDPKNEPAIETRHEQAEREIALAKSLSPEQKGAGTWPNARPPVPGESKLPE